MKIETERLRIFWITGIAGSLFYIVHLIAGQMLYPGYNPAMQAISDLTADGAPSKQIAGLFSFLYGLCMTVFSSSFFLFFREKINRIFTAGTLCFFIMHAVSFTGYMLFPQSQVWSASATAAFDTGTVINTMVTSEAFKDTMHLAVTAFVVLLTIASFILIITGLFRSGAHKQFAFVLLFFFCLLMCGALLIHILPPNYFGIAERINIFAVICYGTVLALWMRRYRGTQKQ